jgi:NAD(P)-dependent dehydrogenase (short-subunit alcohol dehydrogenase family)
MGRFVRKKVVITGAASGIGLAAAAAFAEEGAELGLIDANGQRLSQISEEIRTSKAKPQFSVCSLTGELSAKKAIEELGFGRIDVLVNNAGIDFSAGLGETSEEDFDRVFAVNVKAPFFLCKFASQLMLEGSSIVNVASGAGLVPIMGRPAYNSSKGALIALTKSMALDLAPKIRVNCVCPGAIDTPLLRSSIRKGADPAAELNSIVARYPLKRLGEPEEIARAILFLASPEAKYVTGVALAIDGGRTLH